MKSNEDETNEAYSRALDGAAATGEAGIPHPVRSLLVLNLDDERRHREWLERRLGMNTPEPVIEATFIRTV